MSALQPSRHAYSGTAARDNARVQYGDSYLTHKTEGYAGQSASGNAHQHNGHNYYYASDQRREDESSSRAQRNDNLLRAAKEGQLLRVRRLLELQSDLDCQDDKSNTALHLAVLSGYSDVVEALIQAGADVNAHNNSQETPFYIAVAHATEETSKIVKLLLDSRAEDLWAGPAGYAFRLAAMCENANIWQLFAQRILSLHRQRRPVFEYMVLQVELLDSMAQHPTPMDFIFTDKLRQLRRAYRPARDSQMAQETWSEAKKEYLEVFNLCTTRPPYGLQLLADASNDQFEHYKGCHMIAMAERTASGVITKLMNDTSNLNALSARNNRSPDSRPRQISTTLSWLLRHGAEEEGLRLSPSGFLCVSDVLAIRAFRPMGVTLAEIKRLVANDQKRRFTIFTEDESSDEPSGYLIKANYGHSLRFERPSYQWR